MTGDGPGDEPPRVHPPLSGVRGEADRRMQERIELAERKMADAEALLEIASAQLSVAARNIANANAAEREYRRAVWHYTQLMKHRISNPLQTIIGMADTLRDMPDLEASRRQAMVEAIGEQARVLRDISLEPRVVAEPERVLRPSPMEAAIRLHAMRQDDQPTGPKPAPDPAPAEGATPVITPVEDQEAPEPRRRRSPFTRFRRNEAEHRDED